MIDFNGQHIIGESMIWGIFRTDHPKLFYSCGDIFNFEGYSMDGCVIYMNPGRNMDLDLNMQTIESFARVTNLYDGLFVKCKIFAIESLKLAVVTAGINARYLFHEIPELVEKALDALVDFGCKNVGFHGIPTEKDEFDSEAETIRCIKLWLDKNGEKIDRITLVDRRGKYDRHFKNRIVL